MKKRIKFFTWLHSVNIFNEYCFVLPILADKSQGSGYINFIYSKGKLKFINDFDNSVVSPESNAGQNVYTTISDNKQKKLMRILFKNEKEIFKLFKVIFNERI
jgi:hypothetical protein